MGSRTPDAGRSRTVARTLSWIIVEAEEVGGGGRIQGLRDRPDPSRTNHVDTFVISTRCSQQVCGAKPRGHEKDRRHLRKNLGTDSNTHVNHSSYWVSYQSEGPNQRTFLDGI